MTHKNSDREGIDMHIAMLSNKTSSKLSTNMQIVQKIQKRKVITMVVLNSRMKKIGSTNNKWARM
jgi:hypothetical protein